MSAVGANSAYFRTADGDLDSGVTRDLPLQLFVQIAFDLADLAAADAGYMDVVARAVAFVEVPVAAEVKQIEFVDQAVALQKVDRAIDGNARDFRVDFLRAVENFTRVQMSPRRFHHLQQHAALARQANPART